MFSVPDQTTQKSFFSKIFQAGEQKCITKKINENLNCKMSFFEYELKGEHGVAV